MNAPADMAAFPLRTMVAKEKAWVEARIQQAFADAPGDSPIERIFYTGLWAELAHRAYLHGDLRLLPTLNRGDGPAAGLATDAYYIEPQVQVRNRRVDFVFWAHDGVRWNRLLIECDGHDYHERTKKQATNDRSFDRESQYFGDTVFRFTGSEIYNSLQRCVDDVLRWADRQRGEVAVNG